MSSALAGTRANYKWSLIRKWVTLMRPDVVEAATKEALKKYPLSESEGRDKGRGPGLTLPESLRNIKQ